ncbi:MAG TPA: lipase maturation factor family protein [Patescibacteria group bacterium]|nr:lipase maturation factor family protein [Patescibacteria group bacterium]
MKSQLLLARLSDTGYNSCVRLDFRVVTPPQKPVLVFDGDCNFCRIWVRRWKTSTEDRVEYVPFQDSQVSLRFPELPKAGFETAVHLIETDGSVYRAAEAAFRTLGHAPHEPLILDWYLRWHWFQRLSESSYSFIARHRAVFSVLTRWAWGETVDPSSYFLVRWTFLKGLGIIYLIAFISLWVQIMGLIGSNGVLPASLTMFGFRQEAAMAHVGLQRYDVLPTLCWLNASDGFLKIQCAAGTALSVLLIAGIAPAPCLFLLWLIYLSLTAVSREFLSFQWDVLLLEVGFLAIFFSAPQWFPPRGWRGGMSTLRPPSSPSMLVLWLFRWLLFRLMLGAGLVKLLSGDPTWRNLTALKYHYETQPLPTWIGWFAHQLPGRAQQLSTFIMFAVELALPFLIFAPRRIRCIPCAGFVLLQFLIMLTGNYCFFNLLTILLCLLLLDDATLTGLLPKRWRQVISKPQPKERIAISSDENATAPTEASTDSPPARTDPSPAGKARPPRQWPIQVLSPLACLAIIMPLVKSSARLHLHVSWPSPVVTLFNWISPLRTFNTYGLFEVMTTNRLEIVLQGSNDGVNWLDYEFKYKPGDIKRRPGFVEPHQPRLDWQMWFAVFADYRQNPWFVEFCFRLMNGSPQVQQLLRDNPFPRAPPRYLRALVYQYHFTDLDTLRRTGAWWRRELKGQYLPTITRTQTPKP